MSPAVSKKLQPIASFFRFLSLVASAAHSFCGVCLRGCSTDYASGVFDRPSINGKVYLIMPRSINYHEIFYRIIECISVYMMNIFLACKFFSRMLFDNPSMFIYPIVSFMTNLYSCVLFAPSLHDNLRSYRKILVMFLPSKPLGRIFGFFNHFFIWTSRCIRTTIPLKTTIGINFPQPISTSALTQPFYSFRWHSLSPLFFISLFHVKPNVNIIYGGTC